MIILVYQYPILSLSSVINVYTIAVVANKITLTTAIPMGSDIILVETYPVAENKFNAFFTNRAATPSNAIPGIP